MILKYPDSPHIHFHPKGKTINRVQYSEMLQDQIKPPIQSQRQGRWNLLHENAPPNFSQHIGQIHDIKVLVLEHSPYSPNLLVGVFLFKPINREVRSKHFLNDKVNK
jgi:hypothetical protein